MSEENNNSIGTHIGDISSLLHAHVNDIEHIEHHLRKIEQINREVAFTVCKKYCKYGSKSEYYTLVELPECKDCPIFKLY